MEPQCEILKWNSSCGGLGLRPLHHGLKGRVALLSQWLGMSERFLTF